MAKMFYTETREGEFIFKQGEQAASFFIVQAGEVEILINKELRKTLQAGEGFGELALLFNAPRSASVKTKTMTYCWAIDRGTFKEAVQEIITKEYSENRRFIESISFFGRAKQFQCEINFTFEQNT